MTKNNKILSWCKNPEDGAMEQANNLLNHPCLIGNVCLMPDTHQGYGMPIGGVVALKNAISPNMVGVDIGCGMLAVKTSLTELSTDNLKEIMGKIRKLVPVGFNHQTEKQEHPVFNDSDWEDTVICKKEMNSAKKQIGTLGGGNHFLEIQKGNDGHIWFMIHSGSRNLGYKVARYYNEKAIELNKIFHNDKVVEDELAYIPKGINLFEEYLKEMNLCLKFSNANRDLMRQNVEKSFKEVLDVSFEEPINIQHNYVSLENHFNENVYVHRKGATLARLGTIGIIPGSQGTKSYIVEGLGNEKSLCSCSHGAGRKMSRAKARENLSLEDEAGLMNKKGIIHSIRNKGDLDEAPSAYKDIDVVMEEQKDLVKILVELTPLGVIKG